MERVSGKEAQPGGDGGGWGWREVVGMCQGRGERRGTK